MESEGAQAPRSIKRLRLWRLLCVFVVILLLFPVRNESLPQTGWVIVTPVPSSDPRLTFDAIIVRWRILILTPR